VIRVLSVVVCDLKTRLSLYDVLGLVGIFSQGLEGLGRVTDGIQSIFLHFGSAGSC